MLSDITINFLFATFAIALAILGAIIGAWLQHRYWVRQNQFIKREERVRAAFSVAHRTIEAVDRRITRQRRFLWAIKSGVAEEIERDRISYRAAVDEWMENLGKLKAELWTSFGREEAFFLGEDIHSRLAENGREIEKALRKNNARSFHSIEHELSKISYRSFMFTQDLLDRTHKEKIRGLDNKHLLNYSNWSNLTHSYLIARLFGVSDYK